MGVGFLQLPFGICLENSSIFQKFVFVSFALFLQIFLGDFIEVFITPLLIVIAKRFKDILYKILKLLKGFSVDIVISKMIFQMAPPRKASGDIVMICQISVNLSFHTFSEF